MQIKYSEIANSTFLEILEFLENNWTPKEIAIFLDDVEVVLNSLIEVKIEQYQKSQSKTRSALIGKKHIRIFFRKEDENSIKILLFFDLRQDPKKILELLK